MHELNAVLEFFSRVEIRYKLTDSTPVTFMEGVWVERGIVWINPKMLKEIGDVLHEAGHFAVTPATFRSKIM